MKRRPTVMADALTAAGLKLMQKVPTKRLLREELKYGTARVFALRPSSVATCDRPIGP